MGRLNVSHIPLSKEVNKPEIGKFDLWLKKDVELAIPVSFPVAEKKYRGAIIQETKDATDNIVDTDYQMIETSDDYNQASIRIKNIKRNIYSLSKKKEELLSLLWVTPEDKIEKLNSKLIILSDKLTNLASEKIRLVDWIKIYEEKENN